jgi:hypothetical protein
MEKSEKKTGTQFDPEIFWIELRHLFFPLLLELTHDHPDFLHGKEKGTRPMPLQFSVSSS